MKRLAFLAVLVLAASAVYAFPGFEPVYFPAEVKAVEADLGAKSVGELKVTELIPMAERLNVAWQKDQYVAKNTMLSMLWPGAGQFVTENWAEGVVQTGLHVGITVGSLVWANAVLPADLRLGTMDYLGTSMTSIHNSWGAHSLQDFFPTIGALAVGAVADFAVRGWSAWDARKQSQDYVNAGKVTFEPKIDWEHFGFGMGMKF